MKLFWYLDRLFGRILLGILVLYRFMISPDHSFWAKALARPPYCRYIPSCSSYAVTAIERFGGVRGGWMVLRRLVRCVPWRNGWYDPVPDPCHIHDSKSPGSCHRSDPTNSRIKETTLLK